MIRICGISRIFRANEECEERMNKKKRTEAILTRSAAVLFIIKIFYEISILICVVYEESDVSDAL